APTLRSEASRRAGAADPKALPIERLLDVAHDMAELGRTGEEEGEGWRRSGEGLGAARGREEGGGWRGWREPLELALDKSEKSPGRDSTDVLLALIETYRSLH